MKRSNYPPCALHLFICSHKRDAREGMPCCADAGGEETYAEMKRAVAMNGLAGSVWVTKSGCLGFCNKDGATVAVYPGGEFYISVKPEECRALLESYMTP
ncbi:MAG: (2Fe-2S) ferredoxin domain-containing protein [Planctomycetota bacterium]